MKRDSAIALLGGVGLGAGLALLLDPAGRRRRALLRDRLVHASSTACSWLGETRADLGNRTHGTISTLRSRLRREPVSDPVLAERVRANLGHVLDRADRVEVTAEDGSVEVRGAVAPHEAPRILARIWRVPGVIDVVNRLELLAATDPGEPLAVLDDRAITRTLRVVGYAALGLAGAGATWLAIANRESIRGALEEGARRARKGLRKESRRQRIAHGAKTLLHRVA